MRQNFSAREVYKQRDTLLCPTSGRMLKVLSAAGRSPVLFHGIDIDSRYFGCVEIAVVIWREYEIQN